MCKTDAKLQGKMRIGMDVKCLVQPGDGVMPLVKAITRARKSVEIIIFRFNRSEIERALANAVTRGVHVHALIAYTNRGGEKNLRELESRLLAAGVTVSRTDDDLVRYHGKMMLVDRRQLFLLAFNFTFLDIERSRAFGIITNNRKHVQEAVKLFEADTKRTPYTPGSSTFLVSPVNARKQLGSFLRGAQKELLIYDPEVSDPSMMRIIEARIRAGVDVRIIGSVAGKSDVLQARKLSKIRLHTRTIIRDGKQAFVGSQSLRTLELDARREVGIIFRDPRAVARLVETFNEDWNAKDSQENADREAAVAPDLTVHAIKVAKKVAKAVARDLGPITPVVETTVNKVLAGGIPVELRAPEIEATVRNAVKEAVREVVRGFVEEAVELTEVGKAKS
jgi:phosphatidylserine/phosphatidylglycerophosphate/cardiolipin synthase-like enzyme